MPSPTILLILALTTALTTATLTPRAPQTCPSTTSLSTYDTLCASDSGELLCHSRLDVCCQLPDGKTPYTCAGLGAAHCCGTDEPACGEDPSCLDLKGERSVEGAREAVEPAEGEAGKTAAVPLGTVTGEKGPVATGGVGVVRGWRAGAVMGVVGVVVALMG
jgi:hypothetical protein